MNVYEELSASASKRNAETFRKAHAREIEAITGPLEARIAELEAGKAELEAALAAAKARIAELEAKPKKKGK